MKHGGKSEGKDVEFLEYDMRVWHASYQQLCGEVDLQQDNESE